MESNTNLNNNNNNNEEEDNINNNDLNNSWDGKKKEYDFVHDLEFTEDLKQEAIKIINEDNILLNTDITNQNKNWEKFYKYNKTKIFQNRHYI